MAWHLNEAITDPYAVLSALNLIHNEPGNNIEDYLADDLRREPELNWGSLDEAGRPPDKDLYAWLADDLLMLLEKIHFVRQERLTALGEKTRTGEVALSDALAVGIMKGWDVAYDLQCCLVFLRDWARGSGFSDVYPELQEYKWHSGATLPELMVLMMLLEKKLEAAECVLQLFEVREQALTTFDRTLTTPTEQLKLDMCGYLENHPTYASEINDTSNIGRARASMIFFVSAELAVYEDLLKPDTIEHVELPDILTRRAEWVAERVKDTQLDKIAEILSNKG